jgi:hypothetical protein
MAVLLAEGRLEFKTDKVKEVVEMIQEAIIPSFMPKPSTQCMHDPGLIIPHIWPKLLTENQMS